MQSCQKSRSAGRNPPKICTFPCRGVGAQHNYASALSEEQVPFPSSRCPAPSTDSVKLLLCKSICSAGLSQTPQRAPLGQRATFWGSAGIAQHLPLINPCSKTHTRLMGNTTSLCSRSDASPEPRLLLLRSAPCKPRLEVSQRHTWFVPHSSP